MVMHTAVLQYHTGTQEVVPQICPGPQVAGLSTPGTVIHKLIHRANENKRKKTKTNGRRIIAVYYSTKRLIIVIVSLLII